jgi:ATP-dependent Lon protease
VLFPRENESDLEELPEETREELEFVPVDSIEEAFAVAFDGSLPHLAKPRPLTSERKAAASRA